MEIQKEKYIPTSISKNILFILLILLLFPRFLNAAEDNFKFREAVVEFSDKEPDIRIGLLKEEDRGKIERIVKGYSVFRRIEDIRFNTTEYIYRHIVEDINMTVQLLNGLTLGDYSVKKEDGMISIDDKKGMLIKLKPISKTANRGIYYGQIVYHGKIITELTGDMVIVNDFNTVDKRVKNDLSFYVKFDSGFMNTTIKIFSYIFSPMVKKRISYYVSLIKTLSELIMEYPERVDANLKHHNILSQDALLTFEQRFLSVQK